MDGVTSDVISVLDDYLRDFTKAVNYFIANKLNTEDDILTGEVESYKREHIHESHKVHKNKLFVKQLHKPNTKYRSHKNMKG